MKKLLLFLILTLCAVPVMSAKGGTRGAKICFTERVHDFGTIFVSDGPATYTFRFTSDGTAPVVIESAKAQCGCTKPKFTLRPVDPGKDGEVKITFIPDGYAGEFLKEVTVKTNDPDNRKVKLIIKGNVIPPAK